MDLMNKLFEIFKQYQIVSGKDLSKNSIRIDVESDW